MRDSAKDQLAALVVDRHQAFEQALRATRKRYPTHEFQLFGEAIQKYSDATRLDKKIHRDVVRVVNGLVDFLRVERKSVPGEVLFEADRLECLLFVGYDPQFEGDEPPGL
jgi:hypothetical protein